MNLENIARAFNKYWRNCNSNKFSFKSWNKVALWNLATQLFKKKNRGISDL